jgi:hypothetical protein
VVAQDVEPVAPAWRPASSPAFGSGPERFVLSYVAAGPSIRSVNVETGKRVPTTRADRDRVTSPAQGQQVGPALSPDGSTVAAIRPAGARDELLLNRPDARPRVLFSARGRLLGPAWSPDGKWLLVGWPQADQWLFIRADRPDKVVPYNRIHAQFDPGGNGKGRFPWVQDWILPDR